ncbi:Calmodulin, partial [Rhizophlyctis rosea]
MSSSRLLRPQKDTASSGHRSSTLTRPKQSPQPSPRPSSTSATRTSTSATSLLRSTTSLQPVPRSEVAKSLGLTEEEEEYYHEAFRIFDRDSSNSIDIHELQLAMLSIGLSPSFQELSAMIARVDVDQTGTVEFDEFLRMIVAQSGGLGNIRDDSDLREAF